jgi:hypothetical protein
MSSRVRAQVFAALGLLPGCAGPVAFPKDDGLYQGLDRDHDGYSVADDCDDLDPDAWPGAAERCNRKDDDCDGVIDNGVQGLYWVDADGDRYGAKGEPVAACDPPRGYVSNDLDCDDGSGAVFPEAEERCDDRDNDCDGEIDEIPGWWTDADGDGYGAGEPTASACDPRPDGTADNADDCDDLDPTIWPDAPELCGDGVDNNCDGLRSCVAATVSGPAGDCELTWALEDAITVDGGVPCVGCSFRFTAERQLQLEGTGACAAAEEGVILYEVDRADLLAPGAELWDRPWTADGVWEPELLRFSTLPWELSPGLLLDYWGELDPLEVEGVEYYEGRPFTVSGVPRMSVAAPGPGWAQEAPAGGPELSAAARVIALRRWARAGRAEHASVASFARFSLELMALGAPADLLQGAAEAMADEIAHAQSAFAVVRALGGPELAPGPLDTAGGWPGAQPEDVLLRLILEGCVEETVSAAAAEAALAVAAAPAARAALEQIVRDEARHAALAWRAARWLLGAHPELRAAARSALQAAVAAPAAVEPESADPADLPALRAWGLIDATARAGVRARALVDVVGPAARQLLDA